MDTATFIEHVMERHGMGTDNALFDALSLSSPATRSYHEYLHAQGGQDHEHSEDES